MIICVMKPHYRLQIIKLCLQNLFKHPRRLLTWYELESFQAKIKTKKIKLMRTGKT